MRSKEVIELFVERGKVEYKPWWFFLPFRSWRKWFADRELAKRD